jgi:hypothetical protein
MQKGDAFVFEGDLLVVSEPDYKPGNSVACRFQGIGKDGQPDYFRVKFVNADAVEITGKDLEILGIEEYAELLRTVPGEYKQIAKALGRESVTRLRALAAAYPTLKLWYLPGRLMGRHPGRLTQDLGSLETLQKNVLRSQAVERQLEG